MIRQLIIALSVSILTYLPVASAADSFRPIAAHAIAMHGTPKYKPDFDHNTCRHTGIVASIPFEFERSTTETLSRIRKG